MIPPRLRQIYTSDRSILVLILLIAAVVRFWGIGFGLPHNWCRPDESRIVGLAIRMGGGDLNPHFFNYPTLYIYVLLLLYGFYFFVGRLAGHFHTASDFLYQFAVDPTAFYLIDRWLAALFGIATVYAVYRLARTRFSRGPSLAAAFFLAVTHLHVRDSHFGVTDVPMTCLIVISVFFIVRSRDSKCWKQYLWAGIFAGLATSVKYAGIFLAAPMAIAHVLTIIEEKRPWREIIIDQRIGIFCAAVLLTFLAGTPFALLDSRTFITDFLSESQHLDHGHMDIILGRGWWYHPGFTLLHGMGLPLLLASTAGCVGLFFRDWRRSLALFCFPLLYFAFAGKGHTVFVRYMLPVAPFLCIATAELLRAFERPVSARWGKPAGRCASVALALLLAVPSIKNVICSDWLLGRTDNRLIATRWALANIPVGSTIFQFEGCRLQLNPGQYFIDKFDKYRASVDRRGNSSVLQGVVDRLVRQRRFQEWGFDTRLNTFLTDSAPTADIPDFIITEEAALKYYEAKSPELRAIIGRYYVGVKTFHAMDPDEPRNRYDQQDLFYLPYAGFRNVERPGPNLFVYKRRS